MQLIAHRGYSAIAPENTMAAFDRALQCGATAVECDLQRSRDGHLVVIHDRTLNRTTSGRGAVRSRRLDELRLLSAGYARRFGPRFSGERLLTFDELLRRLQYHAHLFAEIKREAVARDGSDRREMIQWVRELKMMNDVTFISFDWSAIQGMRSMDPDLRLGLLFNLYRPGKIFKTAEKIDACILVGRVDLVERQAPWIEEAHRRGMQVGVYTVDTLPRLKKLEQLGVDAVATNEIGKMIGEFGPVHRTVPPKIRSVDSDSL